MSCELVNSSAVIVGHDVNVSIFKPPWLSRENILTDAELSGDILLSPAVVRIPTERFELLILPDRIQFRPALGSERAQGDTLRVLGGIASILPHTPFTEMGLNFDYQIDMPDSGSFEEWNHMQFAAPFSRVAVPSDQPGVRFGAYLSFDVFDMRLKLDMKPVTAKETINSSNTAHEAMRATFNYHRDLLQPPRANDILEVLGRWDAASALAAEIATVASAQ